MKKRQLLATLLALVLMVSALPITASAYYCEFVSISVDGIFIEDVDAYLDDDNCVRVSTSEDLLKIFPRELEDTVIAYDPWDGIVVEDYVNDFGYESHLKVSYDNGKYFCYTLYIYTDANNSCGDDWSGTDWEYPEVYINGIYTPMFDIYQYWNIDFSKYSTTIFSGNRVYLNNDGNSPVEVVVNGRLIHLPDQQPIIMPIIITPGRAIVPVRTIAEILGFRVNWDTKQNCAVITLGNDTMYIYPSSTIYLFNGKYYNMDVQPVVLKGRTMVPLRCVDEAFKYTVDFHNGDVFTVFLNSK